MYRKIVCAAAISCLALVGCDTGNDTKDSSNPGSSSAKKQAPSADQPFKPRFDGLYYTETPDSTAHRDFVRFFPDGTICKNFDAANASPDKIRTWLKPNRPGAKDYCTSRRDSTNSFTMIREEGTVDFKVKYFDSERGTFELHPTAHNRTYEGKRPKKFYKFSKD